MRRDTDDDMRRRRAFLLRRNAWQRRERERFTRMMCALAVALAMAAVLMIAMTGAGDPKAELTESGIVSPSRMRGKLMQDDRKQRGGWQQQDASICLSSSEKGAGKKNGACAAALRWPLAQIEVISAFDGPDRPWLPGHRGVDLQADEGELIFAPAAGVISFAGTVAGKRVVSMRHGGQVSSFEPAVTALAVGASITKGESFATVSRGSDHCDDSCLHWGVRRGDNDYLDPESLAGRRRIALKPLE